MGQPKILVSAGHHPAAPGASFDTFIEHDEAVKWQRIILDMLSPSIAEAVPIGTLGEKVSYINDKLPELAIEIHFNDFVKWVDSDNDGIASENEFHKAGNGSMTLYYPGSSKGSHAAMLVQSRLGLYFNPSLGIQEGYYRLNPKFGVDFFLSRTRCPSIIIEPEFVVNFRRIQKYRKVGCHAIADGVLEYLGIF